FFALQGLGRLLETITAVREALNPNLRVAGVVMTMFERGTKLAQEVSEDVHRFFTAANATDAWHGARIFAARIRRNIKLAECPSFGQTIYQYAPNSKGAEDYGALADEVINPDTPSSLLQPRVVTADADDVAPTPEAREMVDKPIPEGIITAPPKKATAAARGPAAGAARDDDDEDTAS
ncbi:MAG: ParA family protein, partial [Phycisphaerae bacterium]